MFLTPHGSRCATTVAIVRPLSPKGRAEDRKFDEFFYKLYGCKPSRGELEPEAFPNLEGCKGEKRLA